MSENLNLLVVEDDPFIVVGFINPNSPIPGCTSIMQARKQRQRNKFGVRLIMWPTLT